ncbi:MAG: metalloregulator ArsR/SmtB family transcription factor [bacterium]|nr:metalloregulator ArsR/SmtB family transcription factor [bacterium]
MDDIARFHRILADTTRLRILWLLFNRPELCVCDITAALDMTQSKASRHLAVMRAAGLVADRRAGAWAYYSLQPIVAESRRAQMEQLRSALAADPMASRDLRQLGACLEGRGCDATGNPIGSLR